jgi:hypothetical protein
VAGTLNSHSVRSQEKQVAEWIRVEWQGALPGGERWSSGASFAFLLAAQDAPQLQSELDSIRNRADLAIRSGAPVQALITLLSAGGTVDRVRVESRTDASGLVAVSEDALGGPALVGTGTVNRPHQVAVCVSLLTGIPGRSRRGRAFWPAMGGVLTSPSGVQGNPTPLAIGEAYQALIEAVEDRSGVDALQAVVHSSTLALNTPVTSIRVGDRLDVQNRRRDALVEAYTTIGHPAP